MDLSPSHLTLGDYPSLGISLYGIPAYGGAYPRCCPLSVRLKYSVRVSPILVSLLRRITAA